MISRRGFTKEMATSLPRISNSPIAILLEEDGRKRIPIPPDSVQDKIVSIFNSLNPINLQRKSRALTEIIGDQYWIWAAQYLVIRRTSVESNLHELYSQFLDCFTANELYSLVLKETHGCIEILLNSLKKDKMSKNVSDRALLKNLGHWLGVITLMKNRPILMDSLDLKSLIIEAYWNGIPHLIFVVPFAARIMECCAKSDVFAPPNPWTMGVLNLLSELHQQPEMKLNLKFEIEVLCKHLGVDINGLQQLGMLNRELDPREISYADEHFEKNRQNEPSEEFSKTIPANRCLGPVPVSAFLQERESYDFVEKAESLFRMWICVGGGDPSIGAFSKFVIDLSVAGVIKSDETVAKFFRVCIQYCASQMYKNVQAAKALNVPPLKSPCYKSVDALVRLVSLLVRNVGDNFTTKPKLNLLNKFIGITAGLLIQDHDLRKQDFEPMPYHRFFALLLQDLGHWEFDPIQFEILSSFSNIFHILNPSKVPGFLYCWLDLIGSGNYIGRMMNSEKKCAAMYCKLLIDFFTFMQPFLKDELMVKPVEALYKGVLRVLLVILHDFPTFFCEYRCYLLNAIPPNCIQLRNLVLSPKPN